MTKLIKRLLLSAAGISAAGVLFIAIGAGTGGLSFLTSRAAEKYTDFSTGTLYQEEKIQLDSFSALSIDVSYMDVLLLPSEDGSCYLSYSVYGGRKANPLQYKTENNTLSIKEDHSAASGFFIGIDYGWLAGLVSGQTGRQTPVPVDQVILYMPQDAVLSDVVISSGDGDILIDGLQADSLKAESSYGDLSLTDASLSSLHLTLGDGDMDLNHVSARQTDIQADYGDVTFKDASPGTVLFYSGDGDLTCDNTSFAGTCDFTLTYGDASFQLSDRQIEALSMELTTDYGEIAIRNPLANGTVSHDEDSDITSYLKNGSVSGDMLRVHCDDGDIVVK